MVMKKKIIIMIILISILAFSDCGVGGLACSGGGGC